MDGWLEEKRAKEHSRQEGKAGAAQSVLEGGVAGSAAQTGSRGQG